MKQLLIISFLLLQLVCYSQISKIVTLQELTDKGFVISSKINNYPPDEYPEDSVSVRMGTLNANDGYFVCLLFSVNDSLFKRSKIIQVSGENANPCNEPWVGFEDGYLTAECRWMRGIHHGNKYKVTKGELTFVDGYIYDLNEDVYTQAEKAEKDDDPIAYCNAYAGAQYFSMNQDYYAAKSLRWAYKKALELYKNKDYINAADLMHTLETDCYLVTSQSLAEMIPDEFLRIWSDATLFYLKAGKYEECINLSKMILSFFEDATGVYLQYGDALFETENVEYKTVYKKYVDLMKKIGKEDKIPSRVLERMKI